MEKFEIKNRDNMKIVVQLEGRDNNSGLAFVMHGLGGFKDQPHLGAMTEAFLDNNYTVVRFDTTNTFGESDGNYENATVTNYYDDLEDVIKWAKEQDWHKEPFVLAGHSLGGICTALYAQKYSEQVKALAPIATVISGELLRDSKWLQISLDDWEKVGWKEEMSSDGKRLKRLSWNFMVDIMKYDLFDNVDKLSMPTLMVVGDQDSSTLQEHQQALFDKLSCDKEMHVLEGAPHTFESDKDLTDVKDIFDQWIKNKVK